MAAWPGQQTAVQSPPASEARLGGIWKLNHDLSTDTSGFGRQTPQASGQSGSSGRMGSRGGGRGGFRGGSGASGSSTNSEQMLQLRTLTGEVANAPDRLTIVVSAATTEFTDDQGVVRKFDTSGKKGQIDIDGTKVDVQSKWDQDVLTIELTAGHAKLTETYQVTIEGHALVETMKLQTGSDTGSQSLPVKRIFDKVE